MLPTIAIARSASIILTIADSQPARGSVSLFRNMRYLPRARPPLVARLGESQVLFVALHAHAVRDQRQRPRGLVAGGVVDDDHSCWTSRVCLGIAIRHFNVYSHLLKPG